MKTLTNNQSNELLFIDSTTLVDAPVTGEVIQLGSGDVIPVPVSIESLDCQTVTYKVLLENNQLQNATYLLRLMDLYGDMISSTTVRVDGNSEVNRSYTVIDSGTGASASTKGGGNATDVGRPVLMAPSRYYIKLDEPFSLYIPATNNPTSYSIFNIIDGLTLDTETGLITGTVTGLERLDSMSITVTNEFGSDSRIVPFYMTNEDSSILHPPDDLRVDRVDTSVWYITQWGYRPYDGWQKNIRIYRNDIFKWDLVNTSENSRLLGVPHQNIPDNINTHQAKFVDADGNISRFSDKLLVDGWEAKQVAENENKSETGDSLSVPIIKPIQVYFVQTGVTFDLDLSKLVHNNPTSYSISSYFGGGANSNTGTSYDTSGSFNEQTGVLTTLATGDGLPAFDKFGKAILLKAYNANGESEGTTSVRVRFVEHDPNIIRKPTNIYLDTSEEDYLTWGYDAYNRLIKEIEIYKDGVLVKTILNSNPKGKIIGTGVDNNSGDTWRVRFKDEDGIYSPYSDILVLDTFDSTFDNTFK